MCMDRRYCVHIISLYMYRSRPTRTKDQDMYVQKVLCAHTCTVYVFFTANENEGSGCVCIVGTMDTLLYSTCIVHGQ
jgi:hypothetical protein